MQYAFLLHTTAYLDVPNQAGRDLKLTDSGGLDPKDDPATNSFVSPHTGHLRPSIPSVTLSPFTENAPIRPRITDLSPAEKTHLLRTREKNWDTLTAAKMRKFSVEGQAGVYELQEGIFLICDNYVELRDSVVSTF